MHDVFSLWLDSWEWCISQFVSKPAWVAVLPKILQTGHMEWLHISLHFSVLEHVITVVALQHALIDSFKLEFIIQIIPMPTTRPMDISEEMGNIRINELPVRWSRYVICNWRNPTTVAGFSCSNQVVLGTQVLETIFVNEINKALQKYTKFCCENVLWKHGNYCLPKRLSTIIYNIHQKRDYLQNIKWNSASFNTVQKYQWS